MVQRILGLIETGIFDELTSEFVEDFQHSQGLYADGVVGKKTWGDLDLKDQEDNGVIAFQGWRFIEGLDQMKDSYTKIQMRKDVAKDLEKVVIEIRRTGAVFLTSGAKRRLSAKASRNRSSKSFHYAGLAVDLYVGAAAGDINRDPYVIEKDPVDPRKWIVWARCDSSIEQREIDAWHHKTQKSYTVRGSFINLTALMKKHGFESIRARRSYSAKNYGGSEWWHFQHERSLIAGESTFGDQLLKVWTPKQLRGSPVWDHRYAIFKKEWF